MNLPVIGSIDQASAIAHLEALGYREGDQVYLRAIQSGAGRAIKFSAEFPNLPWKRMAVHQQQGYGIYFVVNGGGQEDAQVETCKAFFYEHDNLDKETQLYLWQSLNLPEPTIQVDTGGKSIHSYFCVEQGIDPKEWRVLQSRLLDYADADRTLKNPSRVMRLAGCWHIATQEISSIVGGCLEPTQVEAITAVLPEVKEPDQPQQRFTSTTDAIPLENCLTKSDRELIESGAPEGQRNASGAKLARNLIGTARFLDWFGHRYSGQPLELFEWFCSKCSPAIGEKEAEQIWKSAEKSNPRPSLSPDAIESCIKAWQRKQNPIEQPKAPVQKEELKEVDAVQADDDIPRIVREYELLKKQIGKRIRMNMMTKGIELDNREIDLDRAKLDLALDHRIYLKSGREDVHDMLCKLADQNAYNPVCEYLESVYQQYGTSTDILNGLADRYFGQPAPIYNAFVVKTLIAAVARAFKPGCKHDEALVLQGPQAYGKSSFFRVLAGQDWFDDSFGSVSDKDERLKLHCAWFVEWAELETVFRRKDVASTKAFLSSQVDRLRPPYGRMVQRMPRQSVIVGSTNEDEFLSDPTGSRRFWVVPVKQRIDIELLTQERDRIWAAAVALYRSGASWNLTDSERKDAAAIASEFQTRDPWHDLIQDFVVYKDIISARDILEEVLKIEPGRQEQTHLMRVAKILRESGWQKRFLHYKGERRKVWVCPDPPLESAEPPVPPKNEVDQEVDRASNASIVETSQKADPPDPPLQEKRKLFRTNGTTAVVNQENHVSPVNSGSGGSGGSEVDISRCLERSASDPPQSNGSSQGGSGGSDSLREIDIEKLIDVEWD